MTNISKEVVEALRIQYKRAKESVIASADMGWVSDTDFAALVSRRDTLLEVLILIGEERTND
jgi:hypothetical protein